MNREMNWERYAQLSQPVREAHGPDATILAHCYAGRQALEAMPHLSEVSALARAEPQAERIVFLAPTPALARQGAMAWLSLTRAMRLSAAPVPDPQEQHIFDLFASALLPSEETDEDTESGPSIPQVSWSEDLLVIPADALAPAKKGPEEMLLSMQEGPGGACLPSCLGDAELVLADVFDGTPSDRLIDQLAGLNKRLVFVAMPDTAGIDYYLRRLSFEQDFRIVRISVPDERHYTELFERYISLSGRELAPENSSADLIRRLRRYRGALFEELDVLRFAEAGMAHGSGAVLTGSDFALYGEAAAYEGVRKLTRLIGLNEVKRSVLGVYAVRSAELAMGKARGRTHNNLAFAGNPGTGKSVVARIYGEILAEAGLSNGRFISAGRRDLVGKYLGHTAHQVDDLFKRAEGGVLFIDEAGGLLQRDNFTQELIVELLRHMEEEPQTTVIFASYPDQIRQLMECDPGFSSRIRRTVTFPDYSEEELCHIFSLMVRDAGWQLAPAGLGAAREVLRELKARKAGTFANAREARRLAEAAIECRCLRMFVPEQMEQLLSSETTAAPTVAAGQILEAGDIRAAAEQLLPRRKAQRRIGFAPVGSAQ